MVTTPAKPKDPSRDEVYTPPELFETMNIHFDVDVCAPKGGVPWIPASKHYSLEDDGLAQDWHGRVWMNPPYSQPALWIDKFIKHHNGITILPFARSRRMHDLYESDAGIVYPRDVRNNDERLFTFIKDGKRHGVYMPVVLIAYGEENIDAIARCGRLR